jgi:hypothetical protein
MMLEIEFTPDGGQTQVIDFDVAVSERFGSGAEITDHAVEDGAPISDHAIPNNDTVTIESVVSNKPITSRNFGMDGAVGATQSRSITVDGQQRSVQVFTHSAAFDRVKRVDEQVRALINASQPVTVRTSLRELSPALIKSYDVQRDVSTGKILDLTMTLRVIRVATTQRVQLADPAERRGQNRRNRGNQPTQDASNRHDSVLGRANAGNALAGLLGR